MQTGSATDMVPTPEMRMAARVGLERIDSFSDSYPKDVVDRARWIARGVALDEASVFALDREHTKVLRSEAPDDILYLLSGGSSGARWAAEKIAEAAVDSLELVDPEIVPARGDELHGLTIQDARRARSERIAAENEQPAELSDGEHEELSLGADNRIQCPECATIQLDSNKRCVHCGSHLSAEVRKSEDNRAFGDGFEAGEEGVPLDVELAWQEDAAQEARRLHHPDWNWGGIHDAQEHVKDALERLPKGGRLGHLHTTMSDAAEHLAMAQHHGHMRGGGAVAEHHMAVAHANINTVKNALPMTHEALEHANLASDSLVTPHEQPPAWKPGDPVDVEKLLESTPKHPGESSFEYQSRLVNKLPPEDKHEVLFALREHYGAVPFIKEAMTKWRQQHNLPEPQQDLSEVKADLPKGKEVAKAFDGIEDAKDDPKVKASFEDFKRQNAEMYDYMTKPESEGGMGIKVKFTDSKDPYSSAKEQADDLENHRHITIEHGLGGDHPLMTPEEYDRFRAVHDVFGHAGVGGGFDRHGEYQAWLAHMSMYQGAGRDAMSSEYHGVNSSLWAGKGSGTGKAVLLPDQLIRTPFDEHGNLVRK